MGNACERVMFRLGQTFRTYCSLRHTKWIDYLGMIETMTNLAIHDSTGQTPIELQTGKAPQYSAPKILGIPQPDPTSSECQVELARQRLRRSAEVRAKQQKKIHVQVFEPGTPVLLRVPGVSNAERKEMSKLFDLYYGPYFIRERVHDNTYKLERADKSIIGTYNVRSLKRYILPVSA